MTETFYGVGTQAVPVCFLHFVVSVRGKLCWTIVHNDDVITGEDGRIYADCIREVLDGIDLRGPHVKDREKSNDAKRIC